MNQKGLKIAILSLFTAFSFNATASSAYSNTNKLIKELHKSESFKTEYEDGGILYRKKYEGIQEKNQVPFSKEAIADNDVIPCFTGDENLSTMVSGDKRKFHEIFGVVGGEGTVNEELSTATGTALQYDGTSIKSFNEIQNNIVEGYRDNGGMRRYCNAKQLQGSGEGEYDVPREYCEAGMETSIFYSSLTDPFGNTPECKLTLDTNIRIDEVRYLRQAISPDNSTGLTYNNYSMGNGLVRCTLKNGQLKLEMLENPPESSTCNAAQYALSPCCNPITGFGCVAQYCQYGADLHCKGQDLPNTGSCDFRRNITTFVKGIVTLTTDDGGQGTFKCQENGNWSTISVTGC
tara:strand:+ start:75 stop:1118 length:1044 start_codon:yes stop_codon:yes gene_type:complete